MDGFVEVTVDATGETQMVPEHWIGDPIVGRGMTPVDPPTDTPAPATPEPPSEVDTVLGEENTGSLIPAARAAVQAVSAVVDAAVEADPPTERSTHEEIDAYAATHGIDLGDAADGTKAQKLDVIASAATTNTDDTESPDETPAAGDEEN